MTLASDLTSLVGGILRDVATATIAVGLVVAAVVFVTRRPSARTPPRPTPSSPRQLAAPAGTVAVARARAARRRADLDPRPSMPTAVALPPAPSAPTAPTRPAATEPQVTPHEVARLVEHLAETNPAFVAELIRSWIHEDDPVSDESDVRAPAGRHRVDQRKDR